MPRTPHMPPGPLSPKTLISPGQYVARLNALMVAQPWFRPGMAVVLRPPYGYPTRLESVGGVQPARLGELRASIDELVEVRPRIGGV